MKAKPSDMSNGDAAPPTIPAHIPAVEDATAEPARSETPSRLRPRQPKVEVTSPPVQAKTSHSKVVKKEKKKNEPRKKVVTRKQQKKKREESEEPEVPVERFPHSATYTLPMRKANHLSECFICAETEPVPDIGESIEAMEKAVINGVMKVEEGEEMEEDPAIDDENEETSSMEIAVKEDAEEGEKDEGEADITANSDKNDEMEVDVKEVEEGQGEKEDAVDEKEETDEKEKEEESVDTETKEEKGTTIDDNYIICAYPRCTQKMHRKCAHEFVCGEYSPTQAQILFGVDGPVCPAHFCSHCYDERHKNASKFGTLVDCKECMRSFHERCMPSGCRLSPGWKKTNWGKRKTFVCHFHTDRQPAIGATMRLKECIECQEPFKDEIPGEQFDENERRVDCKSCTSVFHLGCSFNEVKGPRAELYKNRDVCSYCVTGSVIVPGQMVIAYCHVAANKLPRGTFPGMAMRVSDVSPKTAKSMGNKFGRVGWIPINWIWDGNPYSYSLVHVSRVQRMMVGSERNLTVEDFINEWKHGEKNFKAPTFALYHEAMMKTIKIVTANVNAGGVAHKDLYFENDTNECDCVPDSNGIKCRSDCLNRAILVECTKECDSAPGITCANRSLQHAEERKRTAVEVRLAPKDKGMGLFALHKFTETDFIIEYCGEVVDGMEKERRDDRMAKLRSHDENTYMMGLGRGLFVDARFKGSLARYANHSCDPNAAVVTVDVPTCAKAKNKGQTVYQNKLKMTALRDIKAGEEITFDYDLKKSAGLAVGACRCGAKKCKGNFGADDQERLDEHAIVVVSDDEEENKENKPKKKPTSNLKPIKEEVKTEDVKKEDHKTKDVKKEPKKLASKSIKDEVEEEDVKTEPKKSANVKTEPMEQKTGNKRRASKAFVVDPEEEEKETPSTSTDKATRRSIVVPNKKNK